MSARKGDPPPVDWRAMLQEARTSLEELREQREGGLRELAIVKREQEKLNQRAIDELQRGDEAAAHATMRIRVRIDERTQSVEERVEAANRELVDIARTIDAMEQRTRAERERRAHYEQENPYAAASAPPPATDAENEGAASAAADSDAPALDARPALPPNPYASALPQGERPAPAASPSTTDAGAAIDGAFAEPASHSSSPLDRFGEMEARIDELEAGVELREAGLDPLREDFAQLEAQELMRALRDKMERGEQNPEGAENDALDALRRRMSAED